MDVIVVYITTASVEEARKIGAAAVAENLAACANIIPGMTSLYRWQGEIKEGNETVLILKTRRALFEALETRVKKLHSYDVPCIVALPIEMEHAPYLQWILQETKA